jgi:hypothetical protein
MKQLGDAADEEEFPALYRSFSDMEYQIPVSFFEKHKVQDYLIFKIEGVKESTFLFEYYEPGKGIMHLLPEVNRYVELPPKEYSQYWMDIVEIDTPDFKQAEVEVTVTHEEDRKLNVRFFKCEREGGAKCELERSQLESGKYKAEGISEVT